MAKQIYYTPSYAAVGGGGYSIRGAEPYFPAAVGSTRYSADALPITDGGERAASVYPTQSNGLRITGAEIPGVGIAGSYSAGNTSVGWRMTDGSGVTSVNAGSKRSADALYNQSILAHSTIGPSDALSYSYLKRPKIVSASHLPMYPQRPGEKDCAHYMMTRNCKFGEACIFDHPIWVPEGGIPDWKEVPLVPISESLPERPGEPDCPYFLKTQTCKFGLKCKFNHPKGNSNVSVVVAERNEFLVNAELPERPLEAVCAFYEKTGKCKFGSNCKFHHPKGIQIQFAGRDLGIHEKNEQATYNTDAARGDLKHTKTFVPFTPAMTHNIKGLPLRPGETDCPFYLKTGSCKYGATCRYNHPDSVFFNPMHAANLSNAVITPAATSLPIGVINPAASFLPNIDPRLSQLGVTIYPQRPGEIECDYYMKTGQCKFVERCKFHHPIDRSAPSAAIAKPAQETVKLTLAGLPRREGTVACPFYMRTGTCKYGVACRFDHPPPGEAVAMAAAGNGGTSSEEEEEEDEGEEPENDDAVDATAQ